MKTRRNYTGAAARIETLEGRRLMSASYGFMFPSDGSSLEAGQTVVPHLQMPSGISRTDDVARPFIPRPPANHGHVNVLLDSRFDGLATQLH
jgi:hypothetical protein